MGGGGMPPGAACPWDEAGPVDIECMQISTEARDLLQNGYGIISITTKFENKTHTHKHKHKHQPKDKTRRSYLRFLQDLIMFGGLW